VASVWVPFTSESKEAIASYPEIQKEIRLALQAVGRKLGMYLRRRLRVAQEGQRRSIFLRYLKEVAGAVSVINGVDRDKLYEQLLAVAKKKTAEADVKLDDRGKPIVDEEELELGDNCIIVPQTVPGLPGAAADSDAEEAGAKKAGRGRKKKTAAEEPVMDKQADKQPTTAKNPPKKSAAAPRKSGKRGRK
jgi:DNA topoisomerase-6 subunit B